MKNIVVVDADALIAQAFTDDKNYSKAMSILHKLDELEAHSLYPSTALAEAVTTIQRKFNDKKRADEVAKQFSVSTSEIIPVDSKIYSIAVKKYFLQTRSKKNTLFDAIVAAVADKYKADMVFSFDKFYKKHGFKLASELK